MSLPSRIRESLRELLSMTGEDDVREIEVERRVLGGWRIRVSRGQVASASVAPQAVETPVGQPDVAESDSAPADDGVTIPSPMVGTFYRAPAPEADPFVKEGDTVAVGQIVCIIEAMKIMNEIEAEVNGRVRQVLIENGRPVEYNTPLFVLEPI